MTIPTSLTRWRIRSNIQVHGLLWAVRHEAVRNVPLPWPWQAALVAILHQALDKLIPRPHTGISATNHHHERKPTMNQTPTVTAADITKAIAQIKHNPGRYMPQRPLPTTPGRRKQAVLAAGRDAVAAALFEQVPGTTWGNLTKAIRKGAGDGVVFAAINLAGAQALGLELPQ